MKRIAFIADSHTGSILPLAKRLLQKGYAVDVYMVNIKGYDNTLEGTDCVFSPSQKGIEEIPDSCWPRLKTYINSSNFRLFSIKNYRPFSSVVGLKQVVAYFQQLLIKKCCSQINKQHYCLVNVVGRYTFPDVQYYVKYIEAKTVVSLHEVCNHTNPDFDHPNELMKFLFKNNIPLVLFSKKSVEDICKYTACNKKCVYQINFGPFETYSIFRGQNNILLPEKFILFIGRLTPYKGLDIFYEATKDLPVEKYKFVVAGSGHSVELETMREKSNYIIINRFLKEFEFAELIEKSACVVCPYTSVSQSGIPQTVAVFNKPIIASDLPGFNDLIINDVNGLLFPVSQPIELKHLIEKIDDDKLLRVLQSGSLQFESLFKEYSWDYIVGKFEQYFLK